MMLEGVRGGENLARWEGVCPASRPALKERPEEIRDIPDVCKLSKSRIFAAGYTEKFCFLNRHQNLPGFETAVELAQRLS